MMIIRHSRKGTYFYRSEAEYKKGQWCIWRNNTNASYYFSIVAEATMKCIVSIFMMVFFWLSDLKRNFKREKTA